MFVAKMVKGRKISSTPEQLDNLFYPYNVYKAIL
jgi:hypothetical protein